MTFQAIDIHCSFCSRSDQNAGPLRGSIDGATGTSTLICRECAVIVIDSIEKTQNEQIASPVAGPSSRGEDVFSSIDRNEQIANSLVGLSSREVEVFTSIGRGLTSRQIASKLKIAVSTVETYRERLKDKLNLQSGNELLRSAIIWFEKQAVTGNHTACYSVV